MEYLTTYEPGSVEAISCMRCNSLFCLKCKPALEEYKISPGGSVSSCPRCIGVEPSALARHVIELQEERQFVEGRRIKRQKEELLTVRRMAPANESSDESSAESRKPAEIPPEYDTDGVD